MGRKYLESWVILSLNHVVRGSLFQAKQGVRQSERGVKESLLDKAM